MTQHSLNAVFSKPSMRRRYEVWFLRLRLADGSGAWWFRYLLLNPGRPGGGGCPDNPHGQPVQVWATWFPRDAKPQSFIQGFPQDPLSLSQPRASPFQLGIHDNRIEEDSCRGRLEVEGHHITWELHYRSTLAVTLSEVGWIGFSRTPHSDAVFSGEITLNGQRFCGEPLGYGLQGHNCGFRHRHRWNWTHCFILSPNGQETATFEALEYEMPFGLRFRKVLLWHDAKLYTFKKMEEICRDRDNLQWMFKCSNPGDGSLLTAVIDGGGPCLHRLPYLKTDCSSCFEVANNSLARATLYFRRPGQPLVELTTDGGAVLEMVGP